MMENSKDMETLISLLKQRGFIYQGSEIYGGLAGTWDYGPLGVELKNNIKKLFWKRFVQSRADMYGIDAAILMNQDVWKATGHVDHFADPLVECDKCKKRFREDHVEDVCPECGGALTEARQFNMMFQTHVGALADSASVSYLRPETAQGIFVNFKNIVDSFRPALPFGIAQIGKAFRNEITPRDFIFRTREFEQMEIEYFIEKSTWKNAFDLWEKEMLSFITDIGINPDNVHAVDQGDDRAHYSDRTIDFEYEYPFGQSELCGLAYRTDFDLSNHKLEYLDASTGEKSVPHVIEPSFGLDRLVLAILLDARTEEVVGDDKRIVLKLKKEITPIQVAILPLMKKDGLKEKALELFGSLSASFVCNYDETGSIGKRYRRQDEVGTPLCITVDYDTLEKEAVTIRDRDTMGQTTLPIAELQQYLNEYYT